MAWLGWLPRALVLSEAEHPPAVLNCPDTEANLGDNRSLAAENVGRP